VAGGTVPWPPGMNVTGTAAVPTRFDTSLIEGHTRNKEGGLEDVSGHYPHGGVEAERLKGRQDGETANAEGNNVRS
jgi:hypothetical protein